VFINTVDANTGYTADVAIDSFICQGTNAGYTADAAMHSYICQTQDCSYSSTHFYQQIVKKQDEVSYQQTRLRYLNFDKNFILFSDNDHVIDISVFPHTMKRGSGRE
jgi:hypothetical protein